MTAFRLCRVASVTCLAAALVAAPLTFGVFVLAALHLGRLTVFAAESGPWFVAALLGLVAAGAGLRLAATAAVRRACRPVPVAPRLRLVHSEPATERLITLPVHADAA